MNMITDYAQVTLNKDLKKRKTFLRYNETCNEHIFNITHLVFPGMQ